MQLIKLVPVKQTAKSGTLYQMFRTNTSDELLAEQTVVDYLEFGEMTPPASPAGNKVRLFAKDNGSGKTQICALFPTGAVVELGIEP
jgi:hypothetical protein